MKQMSPYFLEMLCSERVLFEYAFNQFADV